MYIMAVSKQVHKPPSYAILVDCSITLYLINAAKISSKNHKKNLTENDSETPEEY